jgi:TonB family protein
MSTVLRAAVTFAVIACSQSPPGIRPTPTRTTPVDSTAAVFARAEIDQPARPVHFAKPEYPNALRDENICGSADVTYDIGPNGLPEPATVAVVAATRPAFGLAAVEAIQRSRFTRPIRRGVAVRQRVYQRVTFAIGDDVGSAQPSPCR